MEFATSVVINADMSSDGKYLATVSTARIEVYDLQSRTLINKFRGAGLGGVAFAPDNKTLAYVNTNGTLTFFNVETGQETFSKKFRLAKPFRVAWSGNGKYIAMGGRGDNVVLIDIASKEIFASPSTGGKWVMDLEFSPDSKYLAAALRGGNIRIIETESGSQVSSWNAHQMEQMHLPFIPRVISWLREEEISVFQYGRCRMAKHLPHGRHISKRYRPLTFHTMVQCWLQDHTTHLLEE